MFCTCGSIAALRLTSVFGLIYILRYFLTFSYEIFTVKKLIYWDILENLTFTQFCVGNLRNYCLQCCFLYLILKLAHKPAGDCELTVLGPSAMFPTFPDPQAGLQT